MMFYANKSVGTLLKLLNTDGYSLYLSLSSGIFLNIVKYKEISKLKC